MGISAKTRRLAKKFGMNKSSSAYHGGARGNGQHLKALGKDTSEESQRRFNRFSKEQNKDLRKLEGRSE
jgi:hypothetical protein